MCEYIKQNQLKRPNPHMFGFVEKIGNKIFVHKIQIILPLCVKGVPRFKCR